MKHYYGLVCFLKDGSLRVMPVPSLKFAESLLPVVCTLDEPAFVVCSLEPFEQTSFSKGVWSN